MFLNWKELFLGWVVWPGSFFLVAIVFESRVPPLWRRQSRAFLPGDLALPIVWQAISKLVVQDGNLPMSFQVKLVSIFLAFSVAGVALKWCLDDRTNYSPRAACSPTKLYHDVVGYFVYPLYVGFLGISYVAKRMENGVSLPWTFWWWVAAPLVFYVVCVFCDVLAGHNKALEEVKADMEARYPSKWQLIWETGKITFS